MADDVKRTYTEDEHLAILADRVSRETAAVTAERDQLKEGLTEAQTKLDVAESAKLAAEQAAEQAKTDLASFKAETEQREAAAARKETRVATVKEKASHLGDDFFTEERVERIIAMEDEAFEHYVTDLQAVIPPASGERREIPRETAMKGNDDNGGGSQAVSAGRVFLMRNYDPVKEG